MKTLEQLINKKDFYYINPGITTENFPILEIVETKNPVIMRIDKTMSSVEVLEKMKSKGLRPANVYELAIWFNDNKNEIKGSGLWYVALGSLWEDADGNHRVPYVSARSPGDFFWYLGDFENVWSEDRAFFCFCDKKPSDTLNTEKTLDSLTLDSAIKIVKENGYIVSKIY